MQHFIYTKAMRNCKFAHVDFFLNPFENKSKIQLNIKSPCVFQILLFFLRNMGHKFVTKEKVVKGHLH